MNKVILMGRLTREPEVRYSNGAEPVAVARYTLAVNRRFKRKDEPEADFIPCVALGKSGEFAESKKDSGEGKAAAEQSRPAAASNKPAKQMGLADSPGFYPIDETIEDDDLPF